VAGSRLSGVASQYPIQANGQNSEYAQHIIDTGHTYDTVNDTLEVRTSHREERSTTKHNRTVSREQTKRANERYIADTRYPIFDLIINTLMQYNEYFHILKEIPHPFSHPPHHHQHIHFLIIPSRDQNLHNILTQYQQDWLISVHVLQVFSKYFGFPCQSSFHQLIHNHPHLSSVVCTVGQKWLQYQGLSPTPPIIIIKKILVDFMFGSTSYYGQSHFSDMG
jgi:hypothetical protein